MALPANGYPYTRRMKRKQYDGHLRALQIELVKLQVWCRENGKRIAIVFEGRDAAGKGGTINRLTQHLNPRHAKVIALSKPTETERGEWYFQRYIDHLPTAGDIAIFDRSWYNRAGVERVMGFATPEQVQHFLKDVSRFEQMLIDDGIILFKFWLTIGRETQLVRFHQRRHDPLKFWKLSPIDIASLDKWDEYSAAKEDMFRHTHKKATPWTIVRANDKRRSRLGVMQHFLHAIEYDGRDMEKIGPRDRKIVGSSKAFMFDRD
ncbi:MAG: polyphosphate kinase 2 [Rhizobiales bacterium]|nr:polyphosphate kinase 2 [Hyphomicrobiales bacterium]